MTPTLIIGCVAVYSALLFFITWLTTRKANNASYFIGNKASRWYVVAYGMIGASLSGVTFMSVPGWVGTTQFSYLVVVFGYFVGYIIIATVLMPMYYRLNLTSIYGFLEQRFGFWSYKTGAFFFILSRTIGASFRMFLVINVLQTFVFDAMGVPFIVTVGTFIVLILLYTYEGGIKTIVWTDTLQTTFMLLAVVISVTLIVKELNIPFIDVLRSVNASDYSKVIFTDWHDKRFFIKQFLSGIFICIAMTGLDQEMMQKNLSCKNLKDAQKNMFSFSAIMVFVNLLFLLLGATLYFYAEAKGIALPTKTDDIFPTMALQHFGTFAGIVFVIGIISAAYPSADGALTSLTTSACIDFLDFQKRDDEQKKKKTRHLVHLAFAMLLLAVVVLFRAINNEAVIGKLFTVAGYTYGPLLGLFAFGLFVKTSVKDKLVPYICVASPIVCYFLSEHSEQLFNGYKFGFELLLLNGLIVFAGLLLIRKPQTESTTS
ncbi:MAG: sodium:solute symporter [Bacteroidetes bacterium]|nr:sodium:solute symporter [Bacteroidota bacterium]